MKKIAIFSGYHLPHLGGIERYTKNLSDKLVENGYQVSIISSNFQFKEEYYKKENNISYYLLPVRKIFLSRYPIIKKNKITKEIIKKLEEENFDAIIVNTRFHLTSLFGAKFGKKHHIPVYLIEHGSQHLTIDNKVLDYFGAHYEHALTNIIKKYVDYYYGVSKEACKWQKHFGINSNGVWYNSISDFSKDYKSNRDSKMIRFLYAGRILKQKGVYELVKSFEKLEKEYNNIELSIAGDGGYLKELKSLTKSKKIKFLGKLDFDSLCKEYSKTDIFVYAPYWPEGLPTGILEAGLLGCTVISSPQGGNKEIIIDNETGLMINNEEELYQAMKKLIEDKDLRKTLSNNLTNKIKNEFTWDKTSEKVINDIESK